jgi:hypothetical protein
MKTWKWMALVASGAVLLQLSACVTDLALSMLQSAVTQVMGAALRQLLQSATGSAA